MAGLVMCMAFRRCVCSGPWMEAVNVARRGGRALAARQGNPTEEKSDVGVFAPVQFYDRSGNYLASTIVGTFRDAGCLAVPTSNADLIHLTGFESHVLIRCLRLFLQMTSTLQIFIPE